MKRPAHGTLAGVVRRPWLLASVGLAAALQTLIVCRSPEVARDTATFVSMARGLGNPRATFAASAQHPGYPILIWTVHGGRSAMSFDDESRADEIAGWISAARVASGICGVAVVVVLWFLARDAFGPRVADVSAFLAASLPTLRRNAADGLSDAPHLLFYLLAAWLLWRALVAPRWGILFAAGAVSGLAFWIRPEGLCVALVGGAWSAVGLFRSGGRTRAAINVLLIAAGAAALVLPYVLISGKLTDKIVQKPRLPTALKLSVADLSLNPPLPNISEPRATGFVWSTQKVWAASVDVARLLPSRLAECFGILLVPLGMALWAAWRPPYAWRSGAIYGSLVVAHIALAVFLVFVGGYLARRHLHPPVALLLPTAAAVLVRTGNRVATSGFGRRFHLSDRQTLAGCCLCALMLAALSPIYFKPLHRPRSAMAEKVEAVSMLSSQIGMRP